MENCALSVAGASAIPLADASFSKAYTINTVYCWNDLDTPMAEIRRALKPNVVFIHTLYTNEALSRFAHTQLAISATHVQYSK